MSEESRKRTIEKILRINAPMDAVWKALTDAEELVKWFPLDAKVKPGPGGSIWMSWGPPYEGDNPIQIWEPSRHLKLRDQWGDRPKEEHGGEPHSGVPVGMEFLLESEGGYTVLRLVHSGFGAGAEWDDEFDATSRGWDHELESLKHYLERHPGQVRQAIWSRRKVEMPRADVWKRLLSPDGLRFTQKIEPLRAGDPYELTIANTHTLRGRILSITPGEDFCCTVENMNDAFFRFRIEKWSRPRAHTEPNLWLSTYGRSNSEPVLIQDRWSQMLGAFFVQEFRT